MQSIHPSTFRSQVENSQNKEIYSDEAQLIPRGTTVQVSSHWSTVSILASDWLIFQVKRVPLARGEKKTWRVERERKEVVSTGEVTSTSEEGRMDQVSVQMRDYWLEGC